MDLDTENIPSSCFREEEEGPLEDAGRARKMTRSSGGREARVSVGFVKRLPGCDWYGIAEVGEGEYEMYARLLWRTNNAQRLETPKRQTGKRDIMSAAPLVCRDASAEVSGAWKGKKEIRLIGSAGKFDLLSSWFALIGSFRVG